MRAIKYLEYRECLVAQPLSRCSSPTELNSTVVSDTKALNQNSQAAMVITALKKIHGCLRRLVRRACVIIKENLDT